MTVYSLMSALATAASEHDCTNIALIAAANNPSGIPFYTRLGAKVIARQELGFTYSIAPADLAARIAELNATAALPRSLTHSYHSRTRIILVLMSAMNIGHASW